jgi:predicted Zn-dependent peptidase
MVDGREKIYQYSISHGVELMVDPMPGASGVAIGLWFDVGSAYEQDRERGLSHFVEHMVFKGAGDRTAQELSRAIDRVGGYLNAFTERETVCLHCLIPSEHALLALDILLDMAYRPRFAKDEFEREKDVIRNEIMAAEDDLEEASQDEFVAMVYRGHPAARRIAGKVADIQRTDFENLVAFHETHFVRGPAAISVAGAVDPDIFVSKVQAALPNVYGKREIAWTPGPVRFNRERRMVKAAGNQVFFFTGVSIEGKPSEDVFWQLAAASSAYGESMSSRLFMHLREEQGLCYSVTSSFSLSRMANLWGVSSATSPAQFPRFASAYLKEAGELHGNGLSELEVDEAVSRIRGLMELASDDPEYRMKRMARQFMFESVVETVDATMTRFSRGGSINSDTVNAIIKDSLDPAKESVLLFGKLGHRVLRAGESSFGAVLSEPDEAGGLEEPCRG